MSLTVERADNMWRRGRLATLILGPLTFEVNTADEGAIAFGITIGHWTWAWMVVGEEFEVKA